MTIDIDQFLQIVSEAVAGKKVPVVDLIAVQTNDPFKVLTATILSARTKDETTASAAEKLFAKAPTPEALASLAADEIEKLIYPVGFYRNKAKFLASLPAALRQFDYQVPDTMEELLRLPGVGRKTANLVLSVAFQKPAICVDTHVHRIMNIWRYVDTSTPEQTEMVLRRDLPPRHWIPVNALLVAFGQSICTPISPKCDICPLDKKCPKHGVKPRKNRNMKHDRQGNEQTFISWNVNGIRAAEKKGFISIVKELSPEILALQETKAQPDQLSAELKNINGYSSYWHSAVRKGYSGVAIYAKEKPISVIEGIGEDKFDCEGRVLTLEYSTFYFVNIYFPNSGPDLQRLPYKIDFNSALHSFVKNLAAQKNVVICGDYNVAHKEIDLKNPQSNTQNAGFTAEERAWMDDFVNSGFIDTFRMFNPNEEQYTWWSYRFNARARNIGWRIDYFCVDERSRDLVIDAAILQDIMGSDHCPVLLKFKPKQV
ncbi:MAG: exodeoxyribonuclease III [Desulfopila sp.]|jgi:exodeoxyribonuclease-3|nr:exodeoxyribonuclease III [Desulfopila sp.]